MSGPAEWESLIGAPRPSKAERRAAVPGLADWSTRASAALLEISIAAGIVSAYGYLLYYARPAFALIQTLALIVGFHMQPVFAFFYWALAVAFLLWQWALRGLTGQSLGQRMMRIVTVDEDTGRPIGPARSVVRSLLHVVDIAPGFFGFIRPVVHYRRQTWADQICRTVVVEMDVINKMAEVKK
ncbi:putative RDD family membrane protein YckC [Kitasatospora sp. MAA4]|uniref:RDD family protein n=1 Tax=Kitasatospora sp. MAA4 TaxID=3035093 RepID=UPI0024730668|nr:RDD family protein [Kitasatospora sp. MAA4]MDH6135040.1 putative RDD family membrane protein YckC [Kitasatospora sp. MAA4]